MCIVVAVFKKFSGYVEMFNVSNIYAYTVIRFVLEFLFSTLFLKLQYIHLQSRVQSVVLYEIDTVPEQKNIIFT